MAGLVMTTHESGVQICTLAKDPKLQEYFRTMY